MLMTAGPGNSLLLLEGCQKKFRKKSGPRRGKKKVSNVAERNEISSWMYVEGKRGTDGGYKRK